MIQRKEKMKRKSLEKNSGGNEKTEKPVYLRSKEKRKLKLAKHAVELEEYLKREVENKYDLEIAKSKNLERLLHEEKAKSEKLDNLLEKAVQEEMIFENKCLDLQKEANELRKELIEKCCRIIDLKTEAKDLEGSVECEKEIKKGNQS